VFLQENGFVEGQTVAFEIRRAEGQLDRLPALVSELVQRAVALILAGSAPVARAAKAATSTTPIVFGMGEDPVKEGIVDSFNRPGGKITGITNFGNVLVPKRVELLRELVPGSTIFGLLVTPNNPNAGPDTRLRARRRAHELRHRRCRQRAPAGALRRTHSQGCQAGRAAGAAIEQV
jgi:putative ABC transport system substrate-binding protein